MNTKFISTLVNKVLSNNVRSDAAKAYETAKHRDDERHVLASCVGRVGNVCQFVESDNVDTLSILHNEFHDVDKYPLSVVDGTFFSEVLGPLNDRSPDYWHLITETTRLFQEQLVDGAIPYEKINSLGMAIQQLDVLFAKPRIQAPLDVIHKCCGPDPEHPYSKITVFRTTVPVRFGAEVQIFFLEKFLVCYSYLDQGKRKSTVTPIHTHPLNFETAYFGQFGTGAKVVEQEFTPYYRGEPLMSNAQLNPAAIADVNILREYRLQPGPRHEIVPSTKPIILPNYALDEEVLKNPKAILALSGLLRPHQVSVYDDVKNGIDTIYFAIDNYLSPTGTVYVFNEDGTPKIWSHADWDKE